MDTIVAVIRNHISSGDDSRIFRHAGDIIKDGGLVAFPTETVYGLGGDALNPESSKKIYAAKGRPSDNPLIVHIADWTSIKKICVDIPDEAKQLADAFWPGPLTMILKKSSAVPYETTGGLDTVAVRLPDHPVAISLIKAAGGYIAAPSANLSGRPSPTTAAHVIEDMDGRIDMILDDGDVGIGLESTIVDLTERVPVILRPGYVTQEMLNRVLGRVDVDITLMDQGSGQAPKAPGMKYRHYAPKGSMRLIEGDQEAVIRTMNAEVKKARLRGERTGVMITDEIWERVSADVKKSVGNRENEYEIARRLYRILREFDEEGVTAIFSESFSSDGFGQAVMNRLLKAAGYTVEKV
ncbi:MAG: threonylcarbamoyl-AMP synthase [Lachnospiraceae bacterium]|nr:threonylcarbamoyl-AMP synthase [Lachnospiraceae bacterium]